MFSLQATTTSAVQKLSEDINPTKSARFDNLIGKFLRDGASVLGAPISDLCNLSISLSIIPDDCKIAKLKPIYKKESKTEPKKLHTDFAASIHLKNYGKGNSQPNTV